MYVHTEARDLQLPSPFWVFIESTFNLTTVLSLVIEEIDDKLRKFLMDDDARRFRILLDYGRIEYLTACAVRSDGASISDDAYLI